MDACEVDPKSESLVGDAAAMLTCSVDDLTDGLTSRTIVTRGETTVKPLSAAAAADVRDAFAKGVYGRTFIDIVEFISKKLCVRRFVLETDLLIVLVVL